MNRNTGIAEHGFRTRGGNSDKLTVTAFDRVFEVPVMAFDFFLNNFKIGNRRQKLRIPVHQTLVTVNQVLFVQSHEHFAHSRRKAFVHGETFTLPIRRRAKAAQLIGDGATRLFFPFPDFFDELFTAKIMARDVLFAKLAFNNHLGCDARMVRAGLPQGILTVHTVIPHKNVLKRKGQRMPHMEATGHVGRRHHDDIGIGF